MIVRRSTHSLQSPTVRCPQTGEKTLCACRAPGATSYMVITGQFAVPVFRSCWDPGFGDDRSEACAG